MLGIVVAATLIFNDNTQVWREYTGPVNDSVNVIKRSFDGKSKIFRGSR